MAEYFNARKWPNGCGEYFSRAQTLSTTPGFNGWTIKDTSSAGTPTYVVTPGTGAVLTLASNSEEEIVTLYQNDSLTVDIDDLQTLKFYMKVASVSAVTTLVAGLASAQNDTEDSVAAHAWFRMEGSASTSNVVVETDDGVTDNDDKATGQTLSTTIKEFVIDFTNGKSDVRFFIDGVRVASTTTFDMSGYSSRLQPFVQLHKASGTTTPAVTLRAIEMIFSEAI